MKFDFRHTALAICAALCTSLATAQVKIALIEGLSGPFSKPGESVMFHVKAEADLINGNGGIGGQKIEIVPFDGKNSPQESLVQLRAATDQGIRYVIQGTSSAVTHGLVEAIGKWNDRNPDKTVLLFNFAALDPALTNESCSFWHFRFDAHSDMKIEAITNAMEQDKSIQKVFILGQDYVYGHQIAKAAKAMLAKKRPNVAIVGEEYHPIGRVKDFSPYISKIMAKGADTVITGNWGNDLILLIRAARDAGFKGRFFTLNGGTVGTPTALAGISEGQVVNIAEWHRNVPTKTNEWVGAYDRKHAPNQYSLLRVKNLLSMVAKAMKDSGSTDPRKVATALEDMRFAGETGEVWMRKSDHQVMMPLYLSAFVKADGKTVKYDTEDTGYGWKTVAAISSRDSQLPTACVMLRPAGN
ncbi:MAG: branched-chain amino acid ABC transporter substrate-binding protein [Pseudomonadota bacterium]